MLLTNTEYAYTVTFMNDPDLLRLHYYLSATANKGGIVRTSLRGLEEALKMDKMKIRRKLKKLHEDEIIFLLKADRTGTDVMLGEALEEIKRRNNEAWEKEFVESGGDLETYKAVVAFGQIGGTYFISDEKKEEIAEVLDKMASESVSKTIAFETKADREAKEKKMIENQYAMLTMKLGELMAEFEELERIGSDPTKEAQMSK